MVKLPGIALSIGKKNNAHDEADAMYPRGLLRK